MPRLWVGIRCWPAPRWKRSRSGALNRRRWRAQAWWISSSNLISRANNRPPGGNGMTIGKKLYVNFGIILSMVVVLFLVNCWRCKGSTPPRTRPAASLELADATNRALPDDAEPPLPEQLPAQRRHPRSGPHERGSAHSQRKAAQGKSLANSEQERSALDKVEQLEQAWGKEFAQPLIDKRKDVDSGNATVAELQIYYLQKDASSWVKNSTDALDVADGKTANWWTRAASRMRPPAPGPLWLPSSARWRWAGGGHRLHHRQVHHRTADQPDEGGAADRRHRRSGTQHRRQTRHDEIGELARTFAKMVTYLKEMAGVSESIAAAI
jgi:HAMP domain-containing protein